MHHQTCKQTSCKFLHEHLYINKSCILVESDVRHSSNWPTAMLINPGPYAHKSMSSCKRSDGHMWGVQMTKENMQHYKKCFQSHYHGTLNYFAFVLHLISSNKRQWMCGNSKGLHQASQHQQSQHCELLRYVKSDVFRNVHAWIRSVWSLLMAFHHFQGGFPCCCQQMLLHKTINKTIFSKDCKRSLTTMFQSGISILVSF